MDSEALASSQTDPSALIVTVVVPYHGRPEWLADAVASVVHQSLSDFELIIIDDGAADPAGLLPIDARIKYVRQHHAGPGAARNNGLRQARGEYVAFLDADDVFEPRKLEIQVAAMRRRPEIALSHTSYYTMTADGTVVDRVKSASFSGRVYPEIIAHCPIATPTVMVRRELILDWGIEFEEKVPYGEDLAFWIRAAKHGDILGIDAPLTRVRLHGQNAALSPQTQYRAGMEVLARALSEDSSLSPLFRRRARAHVHIATAHMFLEQKDRASARYHFRVGAGLWPFQIGLAITIVRLYLPAPARNFLRWVRQLLKIS